jgi:hypothetical protein
MCTPRETNRLVIGRCVRSRRSTYLTRAALRPLRRPGVAYSLIARLNRDWVLGARSADRRCERGIAKARWRQKTASSVVRWFQRWTPTTAAFRGRPWAQS